MKEKLLILDDEQLILTSLENLFEDDYEVLTTTNAETAIRLALKHDIAVIISDERMPGMSGHEFLGRVREVAQSTRVLMSGFADMSALTEAVNSGQIFAYIPKPWDPLKLKTKVAAATVHFQLIREVEKERGLLRALMESIPDPIYFKDCQSNFTRVNEAQARELGETNSAECIGKSDADYFESEDALRWRWEEEVILRSGRPQVDRMEQLKTASGEKCWISTTKAPMLDRSGAVSGIVGISRDITILKNSEVVLREKNEDLRRAKESAEFANRAKSEFLTTMSHEMRTPMHAILGMADLLSETSLLDEQRNYVEIFQKAGGNLLELINDLLDLSKVEAGHLELELIGFDLHAHLEKIIEMMAPRAQSRGLELKLEVLPDVPQRVLGDAIRLRQILINLIGNALKFTERGSVTLRVERDNVTDLLRFNVVDTGIGIAPEKTQMIFDRFSQADSSMTRKYGGTGLGLSISTGLAELMGGRLGCTSELGKGSTFFLTVPLAVSKDVALPEVKEAAPSALQPVEVSNQPSVVRVLIAEDTPYNLMLIKAYFKDTGFELDFAENGQIALEKAKSGSPHIVLMDLQMPVMDGLSATRAIRQWESETHAIPVPILALSAHAAQEEIDKSMEAGCTEHLTKPIKKATLLEAISRRINGKIKITPAEDMVELVPIYLASIRLQMKEILAGVDSNDCKIAVQLGHQFKGSGQSFGFPEITRAGAALELAAKADDEHEIRSHLAALGTYLDRVEIVGA